MALSYYSIDSETAIADPELQALLHDVWNTDYSVDPNDLLYSENCNSSPSYHFTNGVPFDNVNSLTTEPPFEFDFDFDFEPSHYPKRQKPCDYQHIFNTIAPNPCLTMLQPPEIIAPPQFLDFPAAGYSSGSCDSMRKDLAPPPTGSVSAQSVAARQRRRRITEKTHELGKLVPGGQKMNTAEMLQSAYRYIKFLQAQVALLEFVGSTDKEVGEAPFEGEQVLHILLESPLIQEKLYSTENCLVPHKFLDEEILKSTPNLVPPLEKDH